MIGVGVGSFVIGPLRSSLPLERLYQYSALHPAEGFLLASVPVAYRWLRRESKLKHVVRSWERLVKLVHITRCFHRFLSHLHREDYAKEIQDELDQQK